MQNQKQKALVVKEFKQPPVYEDFDIPQPGPSQVQIKLIGSTINPSDRIIIEGCFFKTQPNFVAGLEGFGEVIKAGSQVNSHLVGKKVSFTTFHGTWSQFTVAQANDVWVIDEDVPVESAASGIINPISVVGIVDTFRKWSNRGTTGKGIINTAAASALGRMLNKYCQREKIPLLNIVRRKEQVQILKQEGATHIINTSDVDWVDQYKQAIKAHGFNVLFDAIAGGDVTDKLISNLPSAGGALMYGKLSSENLVVSRPLIFSGGSLITQYSIFDWLASLNQEELEKIRSSHSNLLKKELATNSIRTIKLQQVPALFKESQAKATQGKFTILI